MYAARFLYFLLLNSFTKPLPQIKSKARFFFAFSESSLQEIVFITKVCAFNVSITEFKSIPFVPVVSSAIYCKFSVETLIDFNKISIDFSVTISFQDSL